jgi:hypothetical protein
VRCEARGRRRGEWVKRRLRDRESAQGTERKA